jgi:hypothetical protein
MRAAGCAQAGGPGDRVTQSEREQLISLGALWHPGIYSHERAVLMSFIQVNAKTICRTGVACAVIVAALLGSHSGAGAAPPSAGTAPAQAGGPCIPAGHGPGIVPVISFGRNGGNIRPFQVDIAPDGTIVYTGTAPLASSYMISWQAVQGLVRLAGAVNFWTMPARLAGANVLPDIATLSIGIRQGCSNAVKTVRAHGSPSLDFTEFFDALMAAAGLGDGQVPAASPQTTSTPGPQAAATPGPQIIHLADNGKTYSYTVGQHFVLMLGADYQWTVAMSTPGLFTRLPNAMMMRGMQGTFTATAPGQTTLTAKGVRACPAGKLCTTTAVLSFSITLVARSAA